MESSLLLRLNDTRQCRPFWHVVSLLLFHSIWKLRLRAFSGPWALVTHEDALQCLFPRWEADTLMSVCPDGVADTLIKVGWRERLRESVREKEGGGRDAGREWQGGKKGWRNRCYESIFGTAPSCCLSRPWLYLIISSRHIEGQRGDRAAVLAQVRASQPGTASHSSPLLSSLAESKFPTTLEVNSDTAKTCT